MEQNPLERQQLIELLGGRIQSGEALRRELSAVFESSARSILGPATEELRATSAAALEDLRRWRESAEEFVRHLEGQSSNVVREQFAILQRSAADLQDALRLAVDNLGSRLDGEANAWAERHASTSAMIHGALDRMEPTLQETRRAAGEIQSAVSSAVKESSDLLRNVSEHGMEEVRRIAAGFEDAIKPLLSDFTEQHRGAYESFKTNSDEFLELQRKQTDAVSSGLSALTAGLERLSTLLLEEMERSREARRTAETSLSELEVRLTQIVTRESERIHNATREILEQMQKVDRSFETRLEHLSAEMQDRNMKSDSLSQSRFWALVSLILGLSIAVFVFHHH